MVKGGTSGSKQTFDLSAEKVVTADIEAEVQKQKNRLRFVLILAAIASTAYVVRQGIITPAEDPESVRCMKAGGTWHPETHDAKDWKVDAYCGRP